MTNKEKSKEIAEKLIGDAATSFLGDINEMSVTFCEWSALKMADWKDQQFISILPEIFDYFENNVGLYDGGLDHSDVDKPAFIEYFSNIITNQYDK